MSCDKCSVVGNFVQVVERLLCVRVGQVEHFCSDTLEEGGEEREEERGEEGEEHTACLRKKILGVIIQPMIRYLSQLYFSSVKSLV